MITTLKEHNQNTNCKQRKMTLHKIEFIAKSRKSGLWFRSQKIVCVYTYYKKIGQTPFINRFGTNTVVQQLDIKMIPQKNTKITVDGYTPLTYEEIKYTSSQELYNVSCPEKWHNDVPIQMRSKLHKQHQTMKGPKRWTQFYKQYTDQ